MSQLQVSKELELIENAKQELQKQLIMNDEAIQQLRDDQNEEFDELIAQQKIIKGRQEKNTLLNKKMKEYKQVLTSIASSLPHINQLLGSKNPGDVVETIQLLTLLKKANIENSEIGIKKMLVLIWTKDKQIKEEILKAYWILYFNDQEQNPIQIAQNLIEILKLSTLNESTSFEELIYCLLDQLEITDEQKKSQKVLAFNNNIFKELWDIFIKLFNKNESQDELNTLRCSLILIRMIVSKKKSLIANKLESFVGIMQDLIQSKKPDFLVMKEISLIVEKFQDKNINRLNTILKHMILLLLKYHGTSDNEWYCACEQVIGMIFQIKKNPENLSQYFLLKLSQFLFKNKTQQIMYPKSPNSKDNNDVDDFVGIEDQNFHFENKLSQLIFVTGHVALKFLLTIDGLENSLKKMKNEAETQYAAKQKDGNENEEMDKIHGGIEAEFDKRVETLHMIGEHCLLQKNLLSQYVPMVVGICQEMAQKQQNIGQTVLERTAILTLCKFMCVSSKFCQEHISLLLSFMQKNVDPIVKNNILISMGDLLHRHPNVIEPFNHQIYNCLKDNDASVRKTTLMVITHLILNDMLKMKGEVSDVALLFEDPDPKIQSLVKLFFHELHKKDNKLIYNLLPEAIGRLSKTDNESVTEEVFETFARNIMQYLEKDKYTETLVDKLCARFKNTQSVKEWRNTSVCMSLLSYNEKALIKLLDLFENYREKLADEKINANFQTILNKVKKITKVECKNLVDEWEYKVTNWDKEEVDERRRQVPSNKDAKKGKRKQNNNNKQISIPQMRRKQDEGFSSDEEIPVQKQVRQKRQVTKKSKQYVVDSDQEDDNHFEQNQDEDEEFM